MFYVDSPAPTRVPIPQPETGPHQCYNRLDDDTCYKMDRKFCVQNGAAYSLCYKTCSNCGKYFYSKISPHLLEINFACFSFKIQKYTICS